MFLLFFFFICFFLTSVVICVTKHYNYISLLYYIIKFSHFYIFLISSNYT
nr:MAG TPA: hypothetical protein [Caudoviricetes sp.]